MTTIIITKLSLPHFSYRYHAEWHLPDGTTYSSYFCNLKDLHEYTSQWPDVKYVKANF